ncbi:hypothetical protein D8B34_02845 [Verminephrobacter eiseniae]|nr:hypothetical protein [Verminephrobacter eiseniae]MCW5294029.1 hypothetical protein [Verminephrobacter eiseniae]MCW8183233.1 hypothetical protein [Verminephrobacter eiseniae]MCW8222174.1 hypothetical protein [Verminephrobacter eiseniae]MCW8232768.1 hypothetical protein [Verminephrobacter eiseniae]
MHFVQDLAGKSVDIDGWNLRHRHPLVLRNIDPDEAGRHRRENVAISGAGTTPPDHVHLPEVIAEPMACYGAEAPSLHPMGRACRLHTRCAGIHPFLDGNGRTGRLLLKFGLMREGFSPPAIVETADRLACQTPGAGRPEISGRWITGAPAPSAAV